MTDDMALERMVRESLGAHAEEVDTTVPVAARAGAAARKRRTGWIALGAAAAVAAAAVVGVAVARVDPPAAEPAPSTPVADWRTEYWNDVRVDVPADWDWGTTPEVEGDRLLFCGGPDEDAVGYVGRPISLTDVCRMGEPDPTEPYVWLGSDVPIGTEDVGNGYVQETVRVGDTVVTVGTDDAALRRQILDSVAVGGPCAPSLDAPPEVVFSGGDEPAARSLLACAYRDNEDGTYELVYAGELDAAAALETEQLVAAAPVLTGDCMNAQGGEWVTLTARGAGWSREYVVDLTCPAVTDPLGRMHRLTPAMVQPWAVDGLPRTLYGPTGGKGAVFEDFIGPQG